MSDHPPRQLCTFLIDGAQFGVDVLRVQEVIRAQPMTSVPRAAEVIHGLINLRGQIVTAVDLRTRLLLPPRPNGKPPMNVVVRTDDGPVSLLVDEIGDVIEVGSADLDPAPETLDPAIASAIVGVLKLTDALLLLLDVDRVTDAEPHHHAVEPTAASA
jgi:purine-binding chemotaxis protein CheW